MTAHLIAARITQHNRTWEDILGALLEDVRHVAWHASIPQDLHVVPPRSSGAPLHEWLEGLAIAIERLREAVEELESEANSTHQDNERLESELASAEFSIVDLRNQVRTLKAMLDASRAEKDALIAQLDAQKALFGGRSTAEATQ